MASETVFLEPIDLTPNPEPNFAEATGSAQFFNYSQSSSGSLTSVDFNILVNGGVAAAIAEADATFINNPAFTDLFTENTAVGEDGAFQVTSSSETKVIANFDIAAGQTFSFDFTADLDLSAKEIENPDAEYSLAKSKTTFAVLDVSNGVENSKLIDFFGLTGKLISSEEKGIFKSGSSGNVSFFADGESDVDGDNGVDFVTGFATGDYQRTFSSDTQLVVVEINTSVVKLRGDYLLDNLGEDVEYGTIWSDYLEGDNNADKMYGSLGNDILAGKKGDDILEGGQGKDRLRGGRGDDKLHGGKGDDTVRGGFGDDTMIGGEGDDVIVGGNGSDVMTGGEGNDDFVFEIWKSLRYGEHDVITDFEVGEDQIEFQGWGHIDSEYWWNGVLSEGRIIDTQDGALFHSNYGGKVLFEGVNVANLSASDFVFA
ncbi:MAG: calcium-binding protein [Symploca sp. SIO3C6]|nr:calcium-binding protein [Symploca sp. SIO3C6]